MMKQTTKWIALCLAVILGLYFIARALGFTLNLLLFAFALTYLAHPVVVRLEKYRMNRWLTVSLVFVVFSGLITMAGIYFVPFLIDQIRELIVELPRITRSLVASVTEFLHRWRIPFDLQIEDLLNYLVTHFQEILKNYSSTALLSLGFVLTNALSLLLWVLNLFLLPVFFFFLIADYEQITTFLMDLIPPAHAKTARRYAKSFDNVLSGYLRGQIIVCFCLALLYSMGFSLVGIKFGILLGCIAGALSMIPYVGATVALLGSITLVTAYTSSTESYIGIAVVMLVAQSIEGFVLTPRLVGNRVGLSPLATILALIAGANLGGFVGMIVAIPAGGILKIILSDLLKRYRESSLYQS